MDNPLQGSYIFARETIRKEHLSSNFSQDYIGDIVRVEWSNIDEGYNGFYDPDDPDDENLLRFDVYVGDDALDNASYCTYMPATTDPDILAKAAKMILDVLLDVGIGNHKRAMEQMSWIKPSDVGG